MQHQSSLPQNKYEQFIMNALIKVASVLQFHAELYRYSQRKISDLADNEGKTERVEPCIDAQSWCFGVYELKRPPTACSLKLDHHRIFNIFNILKALEVRPILLDF